MGKGSSLRKQADEPEHLNGKGNGRKLMDLDEMPEGCDSDIWHLSLYFVQKCEEHGVYAAKTNGLPVVYESLRKRLTIANPSAIRARARTDGITVNWVRVVEVMIDNYFDNRDYQSYYVIDSFIDPVTFDFYIDDAIAVMVRNNLVKNGKLIPQQRGPVLPSKRTEEQQRRHEILSRKYSEQEQLDKMKDFRSRH